MGKFPGDELYLIALNESPSEKEGKSGINGYKRKSPVVQMKVPPKRKGNLRRTGCIDRTS